MSEVKRPFIAAGEDFFDKQLRKYTCITYINGGCLAHPHVVVERYDYESGEPFQQSILGDPVLVVGELYKTADAVVATEAAKVAELRDELERYKKLRADAVVALRNAERENAEAVNRIMMRNGELKCIESILDMKPTFIADLKRLKVVNPEESALLLADTDPMYRHGMRNKKPKRKLLTLWGDTNGDLQWHISNYSDGSGSSFELSFHETEAEAYAALDVRAEGTILGTEFKDNQTYVGDDFKKAAVYLLSRTGRLMSALVYGKITHGADITHRARMARDAGREEERKRAQIMHDAVEKASAYLIAMHGPLATLVPRDDIPDEVVKMFLPAGYFEVPRAGSATPMAAPAPVQPTKRKG